VPSWVEHDQQVGVVRVLVRGQAGPQRDQLLGSSVWVFDHVLEVLV
jgi:hypothetical protein